MLGFSCLCFGVGFLCLGWWVLVLGMFWVGYKSYKVTFMGFFSVEKLRNLDLYLFGTVTFVTNVTFCLFILEVCFWLI